MMQKILITGATGVLGQALVRRLTDGRFAADVAALGRDKEALQTKLAGSGKVKLYDLQELNDGKIDFSAVDCIIHCAFARSQNGSDLAASVEFSQRIFEMARQGKVRRVINISSQSVYGNYRETPSKEEDPVAPNDLYGMAKYACEKIGNLLFANSESRFINVRMASLAGLAYPERIINKMVKFALNTHHLKIVGGTQLFSFLHVEDATQALALLANAPSEKLRSGVYNVGSPECCGIRQLAEMIAGMLKEKYSIKVEIETEEKDVKHSIPLDVNAFARDLGWLPERNFRDIAAEIVNSALSGEK